MKPHSLDTITCKNCTHYSNFFVNQHGYQYRKLHLGICYKNLKQLLDSAEPCDNFKHLTEHKDNRKDKLLKALEKALNSINSIAHFLTND